MLTTYYNHLAPYYKLFYPNWAESVKRQANALDSIIKKHVGLNNTHILDAACGIGTQSIGLAELGYQITASDISVVELEKAKAEAEKRNLNIAFQVADMRDLWSVHQRHFDSIIACDNAIPHLLNDTDILTAFQSFYQCLHPQGGCIISVRDYADMPRQGTQFYPRLTHNTENGKLIIFDIREFEGDFYDMTTYIIEDNDIDTPKTHAIRGGRYYCVPLDTLQNLMIKAEFEQVEILKDVFFQPVIIGIKL